jgi:hypothetical protein
MAETTGNVAKWNRRLQWLLFAAAFVAFAWFHQGGGWNQNGRFAMVRAMVEEKRFWIDSYLIYVLDEAGGCQLRRLPVRNGEFWQNGRQFALVWGDVRQPFPSNGQLQGRLLAMGKRSEAVLQQMAGRKFWLGKLGNQEVEFPDHSVTGLLLQLGNGGRIAVFTNDKTVVTDGGAPGGAITDAAVGKVLNTVCRWDARGFFIAERVETTELTAVRPVEYAALNEKAATGDVSFERGHFHPNKAPGTSFLAVPIYAVIYWIEKSLGINPDGWRALTLNAWLTSVFSVGLLSALGVVVFFRLALAWSNRVLASVWATLSYAFGTMYFSYATMLYEHNIIAALLVVAVYYIYKTKTETPAMHPITGAPLSFAWLWLTLAGLSAGYAAITNYIIAVVVILLGAYAWRAAKKKSALIWFGAGLLGPLLLICFYNVTCFGTPFTTNYRHQNPLFRSEAFLDVFGFPQIGILISVLVSPFRGLFFSAPVLALGIFGLVRMFKSQRLRAEAWLCVGVVGFFLVFMMCYNGWHGGWAAAPRYLLPAVPFLALPAVGAFVRFEIPSLVIAAFSVAINFVTTAVDPQSPVGNGTPGAVPNRPATGDRPLAASFAYSPLTEYEFPFFFAGRPWPFLEAMTTGYLEIYSQQMAGQGVPYGERVRRAEALRADLEKRIEAFNPEPIWVASFEGPVSVNPMGIYEGWFYRLHHPPSQDFGPLSPQARSNAFNVGEFLFPQSRWSLVPLLAVCGVLIYFAVESARQIVAETAPLDARKNRSKH